MTSCLGDGYASTQPKSRGPLPKVAVIGLGTGTMACYAQKGQDLVFFDIDPLVRQISFDGKERYFSFVEDAKRRGANVELRMGDARIRMAKEPDGSYDLIAVDAFSSDAIPVHLITLEALRIFVSKLKDKGIVDACHTAIDLILFRNNIAPALGITHRFVGTEPFCAVTHKYNADMKHWLMSAPLPTPPVTVVEIERKAQSGRAISASEVRRLLRADDFEAMAAIAPPSTVDLLRTKYFDPGAREATGTG